MKKDASWWVTPASVDEFADKNRKQLRFLNRGSIVTCALVDAALRQRWPSRNYREHEISLVVGSAFGNQGETTRYFRGIRKLGIDGVGPMASYDVAVNSFVNFCSIYFGVTGVVQTVSSGAVSGIEALGTALSLLEAGSTDTVLAAGIEHECAEVYAYVGKPRDVESRDVEAGAVLLLERSRTLAGPQRWIVRAESAFADPAKCCSGRVLSELVERLVSIDGARQRDIRVVLAGPPWTSTSELARRVLKIGDARWLDGSEIATPWQLGAAGTLACIEVFECLPGWGASAGLVVLGDGSGWLGAALLRFGD